MLILSKLSKPSWEFQTEHTDVLFEKLKNHICQECFEEVGITENSKGSMDIIYVMLGTACGCEFCLEETES